MKKLKNTFRHRWQKPQKITELTEDRSVSFLELFYDLSYVAIIAQIGHNLVGHLDPITILQFVIVFCLVRWAWINWTMYHELHWNNDIRSRVFTFLQMIALAGMGIFSHGAFGEKYQLFAWSYIFFLIIITYLWWRSWVYDKSHKALSTPYVIWFLITTIVFIISLFVAPPVSFLLWGLWITISLLLPVIVMTTSSSNLWKEQLDQLEAAQKIRPSMVERVGLLTIIVLGEIVIAVVNGWANVHHFDRYTWVAIFSWILFAILMRRIYFDLISHHLPIQKITKRLGRVYAHLPLTMSLVMLGSWLLMMIEVGIHNLSAHHTLFILASIALFLCCVFVLTYTIQKTEILARIVIKARQWILLSLIIMASLFLSNVWSIYIILWANLSLLFPILFWFSTYLSSLDESIAL